MPRTQRSLTDQQALTALEAVANGQRTTKVAAALGVSQTVIHNLVRGRSYQHLARPALLVVPGQGTYRGRPETPERRTVREARFWSLVDVTAGPGECWPFIGTRNADGYGHFSAGRGLIGVVSAHRVAYLLAHGQTENLPKTIYIRHLCANRPCCNPAHLTTGTQRDNMFDRFCLHGDQPGPHAVDSPTQEPPEGWKIAGGAPEDLERAAREAEFWQDVARDSDETACWPWIGGSWHESGYGSVNWEGRHSQASRVALILHQGLTIADVEGQVVRHLCPGGSNESCCNPRHLEFGTQKQNMQDRQSAGKYTRGDAHFSTKLKDAEVKKLREEYWNLSHGQRPKLETLAEQHGVYWGTLHRLLHGKNRANAGGPTGELLTEAVGRTNHARGESHPLATVSDAEVRALREDYWGTSPGLRPSTVALAARYDSNSKTVWNWLNGVSRLKAGGPISEPECEVPADTLF